MITTWINEEEKKAFSHVDDKELDELLQEIRKEFDNKFLIQTTRYDHRTLWDRLTSNYMKTGKSYTLYVMLDKMEAQVMNFPQSHKWSINTAVDKSYIMTFFFGLLNGKSQ